MLGCPCWYDGLHGILGATTPSVEMPPTALFSMVCELARPSALRASNSASNRIEPDLNAVAFGRRGKVSDFPGIVEFQKAGIVDSQRVHGVNLAHEQASSTRRRATNGRAM